MPVPEKPNAPQAAPESQESLKKSPETTIQSLEAEVNEKVKDNPNKDASVPAKLKGSEKPEQREAELMVLRGYLTSVITRLYWQGRKCSAT